MVDSSGPNGVMHEARSDRTYANAGNRLVLSQVASDAIRILDVGCGAGDNARILGRDRSEVRVTGITMSDTEAAQAAAFMEKVHVVDLETCDFSFLNGPYDAVILSHVLEHLRRPAAVLRNLVHHVRPGGQVIIAVPNIAYWHSRLKIARGRFDYEESGAFDSTHLRFFTWRTAPQHLVHGIPELELVRVAGDGSMPLWFLRRHLLPRSWSAKLDRFAARRWPNLFAAQVVMEARVAPPRSANGSVDTIRGRAPPVEL